MRENKKEKRQVPKHITTYEFTTCPESSDMKAPAEKITRPKTQIGEFGYMAMFFDTEGNHVALHSNA